MSFNLLRNSRVFFTTNVDASGTVLATGATDSNTFELQVLDGLSYSQNTTSETVNLAEGGLAPIRGQRSFNTALDPVDFSLTTYMRPADGGTNITAEESVLWNALFAVDAIGGSNPAWSESPTNSTAVVTNSQVHQLQQFGLIIIVDGTSYAIDNCALDTATIDFGLDAIAQIAWTGKGTNLRSVPFTADTANPVALSKQEITSLAVDATGGTYTITYSAQTTAAIAYNATAAQVQAALEALSTITAGDITVSGGVGNSGGTLPYIITWDSSLGNITAPTTTDTLTGGGSATTVTTLAEGGSVGTAKAKNTTAPFIANKLSTLSVIREIDLSGKTYTVPLTGGSLTISNNISYLTPANLGVVNQPATYFVGTRSITGSITAYLRTGTNNTAGLIADMLAESSSQIDPAFAIEIDVGGSTSATRVEFDMPSVVLTIPSIASDQVFGMTINFTAQGSTANAFDITASNELEVRYFTTNS